jgi:hypothetical protein
MPNIELLVEAIRARIRAQVYTLQSDPHPDEAMRADLERLLEILAMLEESRHPSSTWATGQTLH